LLDAPVELLPEELPRGITLHVYGRTRGFLARVYRTEDGVERPARKLFSWGAYGGVTEALAAAVAWQSAQKKARPPIVREQKRVPGYGYVTRGQRSYRDAEGQQRYYPAFIAWFWDADGKPNQTSYSILEHGEAEAERLCYAWLRRERQMLDLAIAG
jgi:hypothetical protein